MTDLGSLKAKLDIHLQEEILQVVQLRGVWLTIVVVVVVFGGGCQFRFLVCGCCVCLLLLFFGGGGFQCMFCCFVFSVASWSITDLYSI